MRNRFFELDGQAFVITSVYAHCPPILSAAKAMGAAVEQQSGRLPKRLRRVQAREVRI